MDRFARLERLLDRLDWLSRQTGWLAGSLAFVMMVGLIREVAGRYVFNAPTDWALDLNGMLLVVMIYLGSAYTTSIDGHVRADFFYGRVIGRKKAWLDVFIDLTCLFYCFILIWQGGVMAWDSFSLGEVSSGGVRWPLWPSQAAVPVGAALTAVCLLAHGTRRIISLLDKEGR